MQTDTFVFGLFSFARERRQKIKFFRRCVTEINIGHSVICSGKIRLDELNLHIHTYLLLMHYSYRKERRYQFYFFSLLQNFVDASMSNGFATVSTRQASLCSTNCKLWVLIFFINVTFINWKYWFILKVLIMFIWFFWMNGKQMVGQRTIWSTNGKRKIRFRLYLDYICHVLPWSNIKVHTVM